jgi:hypothetical protein
MFLFENIFIKTARHTKIGGIRIPDLIHAKRVQFYFIERPSDLSELSEFNGGLLVMHHNCMYSIRCNEELVFHKTFTNLKLETFLILDPHHVLVQFTNQSYFEIYDLLTGDLTTKYSFEKGIKFILGSTSHARIVDLNRRSHADIIVILDLSAIHSLAFQYDNQNEMILCKYKTLQAGVHCKSCTMCSLDTNDVDLYELSLDNGCTLIVDSYDTDLDILYAKLNDIVDYKILTFKESGLLLLGLLNFFFLLYSSVTTAA